MIDLLNVSSFYVLERYFYHKKHHMLFTVISRAISDRCSANKILMFST